MKSLNKLFLMLVLYFLNVSLASAAIVTFDEMGEVGTNDRYIEIGLFSFTVTPYIGSPGIHVYDASSQPGFSVGGSNAVDVFFNSTYRIQLTDGGQFDFTGIFAAASSRYSMEFYGQPNLLNYQYYKNISVPSANIVESPVWYEFNWSNLDYLEIKVGDLNTGLGTLDNFTYSISAVPIPPAIWLFVSGVFPLLAFLKKLPNTVFVHTA